MDRSRAHKIALLASPVWVGAVFLLASSAFALFFSPRPMGDGWVGPLYVGSLLVYFVATPLAGAVSLCKSSNLSIIEKVISCLVYLPTALIIALSIAVYATCGVVSCRL